jgi:hypothetical protein
MIAKWPSSILMVFIAEKTRRQQRLGRRKLDAQSEGSEC